MDRFIDIPSLPRIETTKSPTIVLAYDRMRRELDDLEEWAEFCYFAREYPRCYRFHINASQFRLQSVHSLIQSLRSDLIKQVTEDHPDGELFSTAVSNIQVERIYWDFESFLTETVIALDLMARVVTPAFKEQSPPSFNKLCKWDGSHPVLDLFRQAQKNWVKKLKDYRDCFTHYTPVDTMLSVSLSKRSDGWECRAKLPTNPNVREILGFRFSRRVDLLRYSISVYRHSVAFDRAIANAVLKLYRARQFPVRKDRLFFVGRRDLPQ